MGFPNPSNGNEILYGSSGDVRNEINTFLSQSGYTGHYVDERELPGSLIIRSLERATRLINGYLEPVYADQVPIKAAASVPVLLDDVATDIATFYCLRSSQARVTSVSPEKRRDYYDDHTREGGQDVAKGTLPMLRDRELQLPEFSGAYTDEVKAVRDKGQAPIFDVDNEANWNPDQRTIEDIEGERNI